jgi:hypothetical protein
MQKFSAAKQLEICGGNLEVRPPQKSRDPKLEYKLCPTLWLTIHYA